MVVDKPAAKNSDDDYFVWISEGEEAPLVKMTAVETTVRSSSPVLLLEEG